MHTSRALNREQARELIHGYINPTLHNLRETRAAVEGTLDALEACVVPDPRLTRIEALVAAYDDAGLGHTTFEHEVRAILRGDQ